jgi:hypothetical protein
VSFLRGKTNETRQQLPLEAGRIPVTGQVMMMAPEDRKAYNSFMADFRSALNPYGLVELQLAQRLAQDTWRINRCHAIEENILALGHSEKFANIESGHPEIHGAMVQALRYIDNPKLFTFLSLYEARLTKNFHANMKLLLHLQSLRNPAPKPAAEEKEKTMKAGAGSGFVLQTEAIAPNHPKAA